MTAISVLLFGIILLVIYIGYRSQDTETRLKRLENELATLIRRRRRPEKDGKYLSRVFELLQKNIVVKHTGNCYQAVDILKTAYGARIVRPEEVSHIVSLTVMAMREKQYDIAGILMDTLRLIVKRQANDKIKETLTQLQLAASIALKEKQNFIAAKAVDLVFYILEKADRQADNTVSGPALTVLRSIGVLVIRRRDAAMLREMVAKLTDWYEQADAGNDLIVASLITAWLYRAIYSSEQASFDTVYEFVIKINEMRNLANEARQLLITDIKNLAGTLSLDPVSNRAAVLVKLIVEIGSMHENIKDSQTAVRAAGEIVRMSIHNHDFAAAFPLFAQIMDYGRKLLIMELKFGGEVSAGGYRQHALFFIIKESLSIIEFAVRKRMTDHAADLVAEMIRYWEACPTKIYTLKSFKKFCGLLLLYRAASRRSKRPDSEERLTNLALFTEKEQERIKVFIGGIQYELLSGTGSQI